MSFDKDPIKTISEESSVAILRAFLRAAERRYFPGIPNIVGIEIVDNPNPATLTPLDVIQLNRCVILNEKMCKVLILHELIHHGLLISTGDAHAEEGPPFQAEVERLWKLGAYRQLL